MKLQFGIIGLEQAGKTTVFNALCSAHASVGDYSSGKAANIAMVKIPDDRVDALAELFGSPKRVYAEIEFVDIAGMTAPGSADRQAIAGQLKEGSYIHQLRMTQALLVVIRCFVDDNIPHPQGNVDPARDINDIETELKLIDLVQIDKRVENIQRLLKVKPTDKLKTEMALMTRMKDQLESERPLREMEFTKEDEQFLGSFRFLSIKPILYLLNLDENQISQAAEMEKTLFPDSGKNKAVASLCGKIEMEIQALDEKDRQDFLQELGIKKPAFEKVLQKSYDLLGLITFLTAAENESRAWPIPSGYTAVEAAGEIHTDLQRGFIKAETVHYDDLISLSGWNGARNAGKLRLEGKNYIVKDGDVILFKFNV